MFEQINDPIEVASLFKQGKLVPFKIWWNGREVLIKKVNLMHSSFEGQIKIYYFAVSDGSNYFKLKFDTGSLSWILIEAYSD